MATPQPLTVRLIGCVAVVRDGAEHPVPRPRQRAVLAALAVRAGRPVTVRGLVEAVWGSHAPDSAPANLTTYVSGLRTVLGAPGLLRGLRDGYLLDVCPEAVDALAFEGFAEAGIRAAAAARSDEALAALASAARLWRGEPFAGASGPLCESERARLAEVWPRVREARCAALLDIGRAEEAVIDCATLVREHPLRESAAVLLARALHASGRAAEAVAELDALQARLRAEMGVALGRDTVELHANILRGAAGGRTSAPVRPVELPARFWAFAGRSAELRAVEERAARGEPVVVTGLPGSGKSTLAIEAAHRLSPGFPGGVLYLDLRASGPDEVAVDDALAYLLRSLGVTQVGSRAWRRRQLRERLAARRTLVVLDDADPVRDLAELGVAGVSSSIATVTAGPGVRDHHTVVLKDLTAADALSVLTAGIPLGDGPETRALALRCGGSPLALRVLGARLALGERPPDLLAELNGLADPLDGFTVAGTRLRPRLDRLVASLPEPAADLLAVLGTYPPGEFGIEVASDPGVLAALVDRCLVERVTPRRFRLPGLVRAYTAGLLRTGQLGPA